LPADQEVAVTGREGRMEKKDVVVIGGGAAGYPAASRISQLGGTVMVVEKENWGGICVNWGCIPMLFLLHQVGLIRAIKQAKEDGIQVDNVGIDFGTMKKAKDAFVKSTSERIKANLAGSHIEMVNGSARLVSPDRVEITLEDGRRQTVYAKRVILATGSVPKRLNVKGSDGQGVFTMREALGLYSVPKSAVIIGGGVIGLEIATLWANLGCSTTVVEIMPHLIPTEDLDLSLSMEQILRGEGIQVYTGTEVQGIEDVKGGKSVTIAGREGKHKLEGQVVLFAMGQSPSVEGLGLEGVGVAFNREGIRTNERMETSIPGIYAAGDVTGTIMLANVGMAQGMVAAQNAMGGNETMNYRVVPRTIRTFPEIGAVGLTEQEAKGRGLDVKLGKYPLKGNAKASVHKDRSGFVKIIADGKTEEILGLHVLGPHATELVHEALMIMQMGATVRDVANALHGHPCLHEAINRAAQTMRL
jgi:dihydrolipoamide dehydrogenase